MSADFQSLERALLTGKESKPSSGPPLLVELTRQVVNGAFRDVLISSQTRNFLTIRHTLTEVSDQPLDKWFVLDPSSENEEQEFLRLLLAVSCLQAFLQANWTGPDLNLKSLEILTIPPHLSGHVTEELVHQKSVAELAYGGEPAYHLIEVPLLLRQIGRAHV